MPVIQPFICPRVDYILQFALAYLNPDWFHFKLCLMRVLVLLPTFIGSPISLIFITGQLYWLLFLHGFKFAASIMKPFWAWRLVILYNHYIIIHYIIITIILYNHYTFSL